MSFCASFESMALANLSMEFFISVIVFNLNVSVVIPKCFSFSCVSWLKSSPMTILGFNSKIFSICGLE